MCSGPYELLAESLGPACFIACCCCSSFGSHISSGRSIDQTTRRLAPIAQPNKPETRLRLAPIRKCGRVHSAVVVVVVVGVVLGVCLVGVLGVLGVLGVVVARTTVNLFTQLELN